MRGTEHQFSISITISVAILTAISIISLHHMGVVAFIGFGPLVNSFNLITDYLGYSIPLFVSAFIAYCWCFNKLKSCLTQYDEMQQKDTDQRVSDAGNIHFYNRGMDLFITLFFAIGVLFTAWGMQGALVSAIGGVSKSEAGRLGAWGILKQMVDNGILIALWTTIVGGAGGYLMRLVKFIFLGKALNRFSLKSQETEKERLFNALKSIKDNVDRIEKRMNPAA